MILPPAEPLVQSKSRHRCRLERISLHGAKVRMPLRLRDIHAARAVTH